MSEDRDFEIFSDDLFRNILPRRLEIKSYAKQVPRAPGEPDSNWQPWIGMPISLLSYYFENNFCKYFFPQNVLEIKNRESISRYYSKYIEVLQSLKTCHVFDKLLLLASVTVELCAFCFSEGNRKVINFAPKLYFNAFKYFKKDFFDEGGWCKWKSRTCDDAQYYGVLNGQEIVVNGDWAGNLIFDLCQSAIYFSIELHEGDPRVALLTLEFEYESIVKDIDCTFSIDCPEAEASISISDQLLVIFNMLIIQEKNLAYERLAEIINNQNHVNHLLRYCYFSKLVIKIIGGYVRNNNSDILQFVNLLLKDNPRLANLCIEIMQNIHEMVEKKNFSRQYSTERSFDSISKGSILPEKDSDVPSCEQIISKIKGISSGHEDHNILSQFLHEIAPKDKPRSLLVLNICQIFSNEDAATILLNSNIFKKIMTERVKVPKDHLTDAWILSIMRYLLYCLKGDSSSLMDHDKRTDMHKNEIPTNCTLPKITELKENADSPTTESSLSSSHETLTEIVEFKDQNMETTQTPVSSISILKNNVTKIVRFIDQNMGTVQSPVLSAASHETRKTEVVEDGDLNTKAIDTPISSIQETGKTERVEDGDVNTKAIDTPISSSLEIGKTERVEDSDLNTKAIDTPISSIQETGKTVRVVDGDQNTKTIGTPISSIQETGKIEKGDIDDLNDGKQTPLPYEIHHCYLCSRCFNHIKNKKITIKGQNVEFIFSSKLLKNMKLTLKSKLRRKLEEKSERNESGITCETSVYEKNSSTTEKASETEDLNLLLDDLYLSDNSESS